MSSDFVIQRCADRLIIFINTTSSERPLPLQCCQWYVGLASAQTLAPLRCVILVPEKLNRCTQTGKDPSVGPEWTTVITADNNLWAWLIENMRDVVRVARVIRQHLKIQRWCHSCCWEKVCSRAPHAFCPTVKKNIMVYTTMKRFGISTFFK